MIKIITNFFKIIPNNLKFKLMKIQMFILLLSLAELLTIFSIGLFFQTLSGDTDTVSSILIYLGDVKNYSLSDYISLVSYFVLFIVIVGLILSLICHRVIIGFVYTYGINIGNKLFSTYIKKDWLFHVNQNSSFLSKQINQEINRLTVGILMPIMQLNSKILTAVFIILALLIYNFSFTFFLSAFFIVAYFIIIQLVRPSLINSGNIVSNTIAKRYKMISETFRGIKEVKTLDKSKDFENEIRVAGESFSMAQIKANFLSVAPKYVIEAISIIILIVFIFYQFADASDDLLDILPTLAIFGLAGYKLMPAFQNIYVSIAAIRSNQAAFEVLEKDLNELKDDEDGKNYIKENKSNPIIFKNEICIKNVSFSYPKSKYKTLSDISLNIGFGKITAIAGKTGSGKTTLIDLILGLHKQDKGNILIDKIEHNVTNNKQWQKMIGYVSQSIFLLDGTIAENIAFTFNSKNININKVDKAIERASLKSFVSNLEFGIDTKVGESGLMLSGGQRQRIAIARAFYHEASIFLFDEATSSLDNITENEILSSIKEISVDKTILMVTHNLKSLEFVDYIYVLEDGKISDQGNYNELLNRNNLFNNKN